MTGTKKSSKKIQGRKGGQSSNSSSRGWFGDSEGHAKAGSQSSGNRTGNRGRGRT
jgi:hypothetical protein